MTARDYRKWWSPVLERDMELLVFGSRGTPVLVFPTSMGRFFQWEDFGMIDHLRPRIDGGALQLWCVDSVDAETLYARDRDAHERTARHVAYERYLLEEVFPAIPSADRHVLVAAGASLGATHAAMLATRHPDAITKAVCLSGAYDVSRWLDGAGYFFDPLAFLPGLQDPRYLDPLRATAFVIATGEADPNVHTSRRLAELLRDKDVRVRLDIWEGWAHDWPFWKQMVEAYL